MARLLDWLRDPSLDSVDVDATDRFDAHRRILARKEILKQVFTEFHDRFDTLDRRFFTPRGLRVELGAGIAPMRNTYPDVLATDIVASLQLDRALDAEAMDLPDDSVRAIFGQNCFHHFPHPDRFFSELTRVLAPGGGVVLLEPYFGPAAGLLFKRLFYTEGFDKSWPSWETPAAGPMNGANQALSYIVFERDRAIFESKYPTLKIVHHETCKNYMRYLLSGGLNFRQLIPDGAAPLIKGVETLLSPLASWLALHHIIVLRKSS